ncbi:MAG TPA: DUF1800 domain-containing protein, partial [Gemmataceae bacterium]|nr:DUF1800 domain-containing protein [Gemmataceae bacterium]
AFGATWAELQAAVRDGPEATIRKLLTPGEGQDDFDRLMDALGPETGQVQPGAADDALQAWWLYRLIGTPFPFRERMTLFWHNHFATSVAKVQQFALMKKQNLLLRKHALGKFGPFLLEISKDPAMLIWLDSNTNVKGRPNENYARELMELFSLGVGNYTETDIREAARAFTGWHTNGQEFTFNRYQHDDGPKTVLGQTGNWDGGDVVRIVLEQPAAARFLVRKLYRHFVSEAEPPPDNLLEPLADRFRKSDYDIADLMGVILRSRLFFSEHAYRQRIKSPVEYVVGMLRALEARPDSASGLRGLPAATAGLGQTLFAPPNVKGWEGGKTWLNSATVLARHNLAWQLVQGGADLFGAKINPAALVQRYAGRDNYGRQVDFLLNLLLQPGQGEIADEVRGRLVAFLSAGEPKGGALDRRLRETTHTILVMPAYQLA